MFSMLTVHKDSVSNLHSNDAGKGREGTSRVEGDGIGYARSGIQKLGYDGHSAAGKGISPAVVHNGLIYVSGQGANENESEANLDITTHVQRAMDNVKKLVESAGGDMGHVLQLTVYLATLEFYEAMNRAYRPYFPNRAPERCTVSVAGIPGRSLVEISCIAAVVRH